MGTDTWFVTHGHLDHIAALPVYVARRRMMKMTPPTIYLPGSTIPALREILQQFTRLDRGRLPCELVGTSPGEEIELSRDLIVSVSETAHTIPSLGYVVWERRRKLMAQYRDLSGDQIRDLRLAGKDVTDEVRTPIIAYLGDSAPPGLDNCPAMYKAKILICEMTFVAPNHRREKIHKTGHLHLDDIAERRDRFQNELVIASHLSTRYHSKMVHNMVTQKLPDMLDGRLHLWL